MLKETIVPLTEYAEPWMLEALRDRDGNADMRAQMLAMLERGHTKIEIENGAIVHNQIRVDPADLEQFA